MARASSFKIILIGNVRVGKTSLRKNFMGTTFDKTYMMTLGVDISHKKLEDPRIDLQIWDLAGQEQYASIRDRYYVKTHGILLVFSLIDKESFENLDYWINEFLATTKDHAIPLLLIGNKSDLITPDIDPSQVTREEVDEYLKKVDEKYIFTDLMYIETSAKTGVNVEEAFKTIGAKLLE